MMSYDDSHSTSFGDFSAVVSMIIVVVGGTILYGKLNLNSTLSTIYILIFSCIVGSIYLYRKGLQEKRIKIIVTNNIVKTAISKYINNYEK